MFYEHVGLVMNMVFLIGFFFFKLFSLLNLQVNGSELAFVYLLACENDFRYQSLLFCFILHLKACLESRIWNEVIYDWIGSQNLCPAFMTMLLQLLLMLLLTSPWIKRKDRLALIILYSNQLVLFFSPLFLVQYQLILSVTLQAITPGILGGIFKGLKGGRGENDVDVSSSIGQSSFVKLEDFFSKDPFIDPLASPGADKQVELDIGPRSLHSSLIDCS